MHRRIGEPPAAVGAAKDRTTPSSKVQRPLGEVDGPLRGKEVFFCVSNIPLDKGFKFYEWTFMRYNILKDFLCGFTHQPPSEPTMR